MTSQTLENVLNPSEFFCRQSDGEEDRECQWNEFEWALKWRTGSFDLLRDLVNCHRHGMLMDPDKEYSPFALDIILELCTPRLFEVIFPGIQSNYELRWKFSQSTNAAFGLACVPRCDIDDFVFNHRLSRVEVMVAWDRCISKRFQTGPTSGHVLKHLMSDRVCADPDMHLVNPPSCMFPNRLEFDKGLDDLYFNHKSHLDNFHATVEGLRRVAEGRLPMSYYVKHQSLCEVFGILAGNLLSVNECQWVACYFIRTFGFDRDQSRAFDIAAIFLIKGWLRAQPAYWHLCPAAWKRQTDAISNQLEYHSFERDPSSEFPREFKRCRDQLKSLLMEHLCISGLAELVCATLIGDS